MDLTTSDYALPAIDTGTQPTSKKHSSGRRLRITSFGKEYGPLFPETSDEPSSEHPGYPVHRLTFNAPDAVPAPSKDLEHQQTGLSQAVQGSLLSDSEARDNIDGIYASIRKALQEADEKCGGQGSAEVDVGVYCSFGKHRSVTVVETLEKEWPEEWDVEYKHRDLPRLMPSSKQS